MSSDRASDGSPQLRLMIVRPHAAQWENTLPIFNLHLVGGKGASAIRIDPVRSHRFEDLEIHFESADMLDATRKVVPVSVILKSGERRHTNHLERDFFLRDCSDAVSVSYPMLIRFSWDGQEHTAEMNLVWDASRRSLHLSGSES